jgi:hypothetical protein
MRLKLSWAVLALGVGMSGCALGQVREFRCKPGDQSAIVTNSSGSWMNGLTLSSPRNAP